VEGGGGKGKGRREGRVAPQLGSLDSPMLKWTTRVAKCRPPTATLLTANDTCSVHISCAIVLAVVLYISGKIAILCISNAVLLYFQFIYYLLRCCTCMLGLTGPPNIFLVAPPHVARFPCDSTAFLFSITYTVILNVMMEMYLLKVATSN